MATFRQLEIFAAVAEYKKMNLAASKLYIAQPTVSQTIIDLEKEYDTILFERHNKELKITPAGMLLLRRAKEIIALHEGLDQEMKNLHEQRPLKIGATLTIGNTLISELITLLNQEYPDIDVSVYIDNTRLLEHRMMHNELDLALVEGIILRKEIHTEPVFHDHLEIICGPVVLLHKNLPFRLKILPIRILSCASEEAERGLSLKILCTHTTFRLLQNGSAAAKLCHY